MADGWLTKLVSLEGGLLTNLPPVTQGINAPGSLTRAVNFEPGTSGGYRRISGYTPLREGAVPGAGKVLGVVVAHDGVLAARGVDVYYASPTVDWTQVNTTARTGAGGYRFARYRWSEEVTVMVDGVNLPAKWNGTTYTSLAAAPLAATEVCEHRNHLFFAKDAILTWSQPGDDTGYSGGSGAGALNVGFDIVALAPWRGDLYVFGRNAIKRLTGSTYADFAVVPVTASIGCVAAGTVKEIGGDLVFLSPDGVRTISGTDRIGDVELQSVSRPVNPTLAQLASNYATTGDISAVVVRGKSQIRFFFARDTDAQFACKGVLGGLRLADAGLGWEWFETLGFQVACADSGYASGVELTVHGGYDGFVYRQETGFSFNGTGIPSILETANLPFDDPALRKTLYKLSAYVELEGAVDIAVQPVFEFGDLSVIQPPQTTLSGTNLGNAVFDAPTTNFDDAGADADFFDQPPSTYITAYLVGSANFISLRFVTGANVPCWAIKTLTIEYSLGGRS